MKLPTIPKCCCLDLKTVGLIYGCIGIIFFGSVISAILSTGPRIFLAILPVSLFGSIFVAWILGIHEAKPIFMIPVLLFSASISLVLCIMAFVLPTIFICGSALSGRIGIDFETLGILHLAVWTSACLISVFHVYLTIAKYSLYKAITDETKSSATRNNAC